MMLNKSTICLLLLTTSSLLTASRCAEYGVDVSFPVHHGLKDTNLLGDKHALYKEFIEGCRNYYGKKGHACDETEEDRLKMSVRQPQSMVNYTDTGFKKIRAPDELWKLLSTHWEKNKDKKKSERWNAGNTYTNNWAAPTYMVSVEDTSLRGGGMSLKNKIWDAAKETIEQWTGMEQKPISLYGIREYTEGAILAPHADRLPLVSSCIVNVAQDVDEDWPLEVYDREGNAVNVTMQPGDMVLYESHSLIHGRPFPLKGRSFANIFIHFEPTGRLLGDVNGGDWDGELPPYIIEDSPEVDNWIRRNPGGMKHRAPSASQVDTPDVQRAAASGDMDHLQKIARKNKRLLHQKDKNGWAAIHEASRSGHKDVVELLIKHGADYNERTNGGKGGSPLYLSIHAHTEKHPLSQYLLSLGALSIEPEL